MAKTFKDFVQEAKSQIKELTVDDVKRKIDAGENVTLIDVREDEEWAKGRLPGAVHLGRGVLERDAQKTLTRPDAEIVAYCGGGARSALAARTLREMGYTNVASMDGGFGMWREMGYDVET